MILGMTFNLRSLTYCRFLCLGSLSAMFVLYGKELLWMLFVYKRAQLTRAYPIKGERISVIFLPDVLVAEMDPFPAPE